MIRTTRLAAAALSAVLGLGTVFVNASPVTASGPAAPSGDFYDPPSSLPTTNGTVVKQQPTKLTLSFKLGGKDTRLPGTATKIMYKSTDEGGDAAAVTGVYIEPAKRWTGKGARPLVSYSVGTQGVGDACAPSKTLENIINIENGQFMVGYEVPSIYRLLSKGVAVVVTDYIGLGTTDRVHTYMNRTDQAHAVLDAARAALTLPNTSISEQSPIGLYGYSQGGGASAAAAELAPTYAPELNLKGAYAGGPPADLYEVMKTIDGGLLASAIPWSINAMLPYRKDMTPYLTKILNPKAIAYMEQSKTQCIVDAILEGAFTKTSTWTNSGHTAAQEVAASPEVRRAVDEQRIGNRTPKIPVMVLTGTKDDTVAHGQAKQLALDWCARGVNVTYKPVIQLINTGGVLVSHMTPMITQMGSSQDWLLDRLNGKSVRSNCSTARFLP